MSIIAINGKIGTGKDTIGKIVQYLVSTKNEKNVVSFEDAIKYDSSFITSKSSGWEVRKFAKKLKEIASILTGIPIEKFEDQEFKKTFLGKEWNYYLDHNLKNNFISPYTIKGGANNAGEDELYSYKMTVRDLLQKLGTEALRNGLHENVWVNALFADYKLDFGCKNKCQNDIDGLNKGDYCINPLYCQNGKYPNWLITDLRFPNEFQAVKDRNGICVRVNRPVKAEGNQNAGLLHASEVALDQYTFDWEIQNSGSIENLVEEVRKMLINFKII